MLIVFWINVFKFCEVLEYASTLCVYCQMVSGMFNISLENAFFQ